MTRRGGNGKEGKGMYRLNGTIQDFDIAKEIGETIAIASFVRNGRLSLLISTLLANRFFNVDDYDRAWRRH